MVPVTLAVRLMLVVVPEQIVLDLGEVVITGLGFTVTSTWPSWPVQPFALPENVYLTTAGIIPRLVNFCLIRDPDPAE